MKQRLASDLASLYLDRDPANLPDFDAAMRRARLVIDIDPENSNARRFLIRATVHHVEERLKEGDRSFSRFYGLLNDLRRHAEWLEAKLGSLGAEERDDLRSDLASFYDTIGNVKNSEGMQTTDQSNDVEGRIGSLLDSINAGVPGLLGSLEENVRKHNRLLAQVRECYRESDGAFERSLRLDPVNAHARSQMDHHARQYDTIAGLTDRNNEILRQIAQVYR
ncbi:MAG TPA: hypothetical protein VNO14_09085 [Blastocatellia bacterium]|nr:hypothetical protein [Blastocatellia bacterium]